MKSENHYITLILKHLEGELSSVEERELHDWIDQDDKNEQLFEQIKFNWNEELPDIPVYDVQGAFQKISRQLLLSVEDIPEVVSSRKKKLQIHPFRPWLKIAAVFIGILIISEFVYQGFFNKTTSFTTENDQIATIMLPDQSVVTLYANSSITYDKEWEGIKSREIFLEGEAFFEVEKDIHKPFLVSTSDLTIKVLGTSFNVKSYLEDEFIETTLVEGSVEINEIIESEGASEDKITLIPSQKALFSKKTKDLTLYQVDMEPYESLKDEDFVFNNELVSEIIKVISKKFKVSIKTENKGINRCTVTADFSGQPLEITLGLLCRLIDAKYDIDNQEIILKGKGCKIS